MPKLDPQVLQDPVKFLALGWPEIKIYDKQAEILYSVRDNDVTVVPAGNMLGKDFISAYCAIWWFNSRRPAKVVTSSVDAPQLNTVLWGEMRRFVQTCRFPLPMEMNQQEAYQLDDESNRIPLGTMIGRVAKRGEGLLGQHLAITNDGRMNDGLPRTLMIFDEASGIEDAHFETASTWAHRILVIGNPYPCQNFFRKAVRVGDIPRDKGGGYHQKIIKIKAMDSPNVRIPMQEEQAGREVANQRLIPGLIWYDEYKKRRKLWDPIRQCVSLDAEFYEGKELLLYPPDWLNHSEALALNPPPKRKQFWMGVDPGEGGDDSAWAIVDHFGLVYLLAKKTSDTSQIVNTTLGLMREYSIPPENVAFDRGGGGKQHADNMRAQGYEVRTIGFGEAATNPESYKKQFSAAKSNDTRRDESELRYVYKNRRAEMYGLLSQAIDPSLGNGFALPAEYSELRRQLSPIPKLYDGEGRLYLPPKDKPTPNYTGSTLREILGCSPDEADALVLAHFCMVQKQIKRLLGAY